LPVQEWQVVHAPAVLPLKGEGAHAIPYIMHPRVVWEVDAALVRHAAHLAILVAPVVYLARGQPLLNGKVRAPVTVTPTGTALATLARAYEGKTVNRELGH